METNFYTDEFEQLLKEKADQFRMYPSKRVWHSIYNNLHPSRRWPSAVIAIFLFFSVVYTGYLNTDENSPNQFAGNGNKGTALSSNKENTEPEGNTVAGNDLLLPGLVRSSNTSASIKTIPAVSPYSDPGSGNVTAQSPKIEKDPAGNNIINTVDTYIKSNQVISDIVNSKKKVRINSASPVLAETTAQEEADKNDTELTADPELNARLDADKENAVVKKENKADIKQLSPEEKAWIENYAMDNKKSERNKWKKKMDYEFYVTPAVNYRTLTTDAKGSVSLFATGDVNRSISQKPGLGVEAGFGLSYSLAKNLRLKGGVQFNYTNYNIKANETQHPVSAMLMLNDPNTGYSYMASRTSTKSNAYYSSGPLQPVVLHNRTYQVSVPIGLSLRLSGKNNVEWFAGASAQPTYVFGGKANLISADLRSYISEPSSIREWNLNLGFETYMSYKLGSYNLQVGPRVRYQMYSTYRKNIALIEKPYAIGFRIGLVKGF
jgi:hypothetical protein